MPKKYLSKTLKRIEKIIEEGATLTGRKRNSLFEDYLRQFYRHAPYEYLSSIKPVFLYHAALGSWQFIYDRKASIQRRVRVFNPTMDKHGWESSRTIVELNTDDSPFILDSITAELIEHHYKIYEVMHPVLKLKRDARGKITELYDMEADALPKEGKMESSMHFQISHIDEEKERARLERDIENSLHFVNLAVGDWKPMIARTQEVANALDPATLPFKQDYVAEVRDFLYWCANNNFIMLGFRDYDFVDNKGKHKLSYNSEEDLGIFRAQYKGKKPHEAKPQGLLEIPEDTFNPKAPHDLLEITKSSRKSVVHRPVHMDYIGVKKFNSKGDVIGEYRFLGLFTSAVYYQSARTIPVIRKKIDKILKRSGFPPDSHNGKSLVTVLDAYPRDEVLQITEEELFTIAMGIVGLAEKPRTKLFVRKDRYSRFFSCIVFVPRDRYNTHMREKVQSVLEKSFSGEITDYYTQVTESPLARLHFLVKVTSENVPNVDVDQLEHELIEITNSWVNGLRDTLIRLFEERHGEKLFINYVDAFPESFKDSYHFGGTACDIIKIEEAYKHNRLTLDLYQHEKEDEYTYHLKLYHPETQVMLSEVLPILENMGFEGIDERTFLIKPLHQREGLWVHHFRLKVSRTNLYNSHPAEESLSYIKEEFEDALYHVWHKTIEDDALNKLIMRGNIKWRDITLLRAYSKYSIQGTLQYSHDYIASVIARHPALSQLLVDLFYAKFDPDIKVKDRAEQTKTIASRINKKLVSVKSIAEDKIIRQFFETIQATLRTNYFQTTEDQCFKPYISLKLDSANVPNLPKPHPYREIFVYSPEIEGIHLRGGKVARGGLRWSDRTEDFRTEVLGLVKAQMTKNSVIVPVGSKGGFVVKHPINGDREARLEQGKTCYKIYLRGLLDITDNIVRGNIFHPEHVVIHDDDDPYLVVAADKGTATFSDLANSVSEEYSFWLGDAFASGGSVGYDHKKMGITARGAWVSVQRHFIELGVDCQREDITVVGIGDMSGDVFGNGMLLSKHICLVGAFNHLHIFIDPTPDAAISYKERQRLFKLPRSSWEDYDAKLISKGGGIFSRSVKSIKVSKEMKTRFGIDSPTISPDSLIQVLLKAEVDLLWNGGIGTYVKSDHESHEAVGDKANDAVRVTAKELNCKVVGEGGNLGFTQHARIAYAMNGGKINTDAIDNSAGVDCSDHEVNIKIALQDAVNHNKITLEERNKILAAMTDDVAELVLFDNQLQTQALSIAEQQGSVLVEPHVRLLHTLENIGLLDRSIEFLPDDDELHNRQIHNYGMVRPELSVTLAYSKLALYDELINTNLPDDKHMITDLIHYFPETMHTQFRKEIEGHQLRREIIATAIANSIVNRMGCTYFYRMKEDTGMKGCDVARAYIITRDAFKLHSLWQEIEEAGNIIPFAAQTTLYLEIRKLVERTSSWFLRNHPHPLKAEKLVQEYRAGIKELITCLDQVMSDASRQARDSKYALLTGIGVPEALAKKVANLEALASACDIVSVAKGGKLPIKTIGQIYYELGNRFRLGWLRHAATELLSHSHWDNLAIQTITETLFDQQMKLTANVTNGACKDDVCTNALDTWYEHNEKSITRYDAFIGDLKKQEPITSAMLTVAIQRTEALCTK